MLLNHLFDFIHKKNRTTISFSYIQFQVGFYEIYYLYVGKITQYHRNGQKVKCNF